MAPRNRPAETCPSRFNHQYWSTLIRHVAINAVGNQIRAASNHELAPLYGAPTHCMTKKAKPPCIAYLRATFIFTVLVFFCAQYALDERAGAKSADHNSFRVSLL